MATIGIRIHFPPTDVGEQTKTPKQTNKNQKNPPQAIWGPVLWLWADPVSFLGQPSSLIGLAWLRKPLQVATFFFLSPPLVQRAVVRGADSYGYTVYQPSSAAGIAGLVSLL